MKKSLFVVLITVICFAFMSASSVFAQETPKKVFASMDTNKDGKVSQEEFMNYYIEYIEKSRNPRFEKLDTDKDGCISREEFMAVSVSEAQQLGKAKFRRIDANKDGAISEDELDKRFRAVQKSLEQLKAE
jgi:Ca2+-binding EF-hand superfamily protein